jgi:hypothetical protein
MMSQMIIPPSTPVFHAVTLPLCFGCRFLLTIVPFIQVDVHPRASFIGLMFLLEPHEFGFFSQIPQVYRLARIPQH